jgi:hypothetical protein
MKTLRLLILFSLVVLGAYVEDKANAEVRDMKYPVQANGKGPVYEVDGHFELRNAGFKNKD